MNASTLWTNYENLSDDVKWARVKYQADLMLSESAQTQLPDSGLSIAKRLEWQTYRDALRSIKDDFSNPDDVVFPEPPAEE